MDPMGLGRAKGSTLDRSILLDPPAAALVPPKFEFSKLENGAVGADGWGWMGGVYN